MIALALAASAVAGVMSCGPEAEPERCYGDQVSNVVVGIVGLTCNDDEPFEDLTEPERYPHTSGVQVLAAPEPDGSCPAMCPAEADPLFWQAFLDQVDRRGLADGEDPGCLDEGYLVELGCRFPDPNTDKCVYHGLIATACELGPMVTP